MTHNQYDYTLQKLKWSINVLLTDTGDARRRLYLASRSFCKLNDNDFPLSLKEKWQEIIANITKSGPLLDHYGQVLKCAVENTMCLIKNKTASKIIKEVYDLYCSIGKNVQFQ